MQQAYIRQVFTRKIAVTTYFTQKIDIGQKLGYKCEYEFIDIPETFDKPSNGT